jgi:hypothetical protein
MNPLLRNFFNEEKKRVFTPDPQYHQRILAKLGSATPRENEIWDFIPGAARPVFALAVSLMFLFLALDVLSPLGPATPLLPEQGFIEAFLAPEQTPNEAFLYTDTELPADQEFLEQLMAYEERK